MNSKSITMTTGEPGGLSSAQKADLRRAVRKVSQLLQEDSLTPTMITQIYDDIFNRKSNKGSRRFSELLGKSDPRFNSALYPPLDPYFERENSESHKTKLEWRNASELLALACKETVLTRLLAAYIWKRGELDRVKHVLAGINSIGQPAEIGSKKVPAADNDGAGGDQKKRHRPSVMWQFGRHLASPAIEPICDQHTFRAYKMLSLSRNPSNHLQDNYDKLSYNHIKQYVDWWTRKIVPKLPHSDVDRRNAMYELDKLLFSLGKAALLPPKRGEPRRGRARAQGGAA